MNYTTNETKAIQQVAAKIAKSSFGYWCCDGVNFFSIHGDYLLSVPCSGCGCWSISRGVFNDAVKASKELSIEYNQENNVLSINGFKVTPNEYEKEIDKNIVESKETSINKGSFYINHNAKELLNAVDFVSKDCTRYNLTGVCIDSGLWATDGHKAIITNDPIPPKAKSEIIIPAEFIKMFGKLPAEFKASEDNKQILCEIANVKIITKAIEGPYPNIRSVIPTMFENNFYIDYKDYKKLDAFLEKAKKLVKRTKKFAFIPCENCIKLNAVDIDTRVSINETLENSYFQGENPVNIGFDASCAQLILKKISKENTEGFKIEYNNALSATIWNRNYLLMPTILVE
jgi:hypothetical protein